MDKFSRKHRFDYPLLADSDHAVAEGFLRPQHRAVLSVASEPAELLDRLAAFPADEREGGPALAQAALDRFTGPVEGNTPRHELVVTHNFLIGWLVRAALDAPPWRWLGLNHTNAGLTVIRYAPGRPASLLLYNDTGHLPPELRWTGLPPELHV